MSGSDDEEPRDDAPRPQQPSQPPWQQPSQPFATPPLRQYPQPASWPLLEPPSPRQYPQPASWSPAEPPAPRYAHRSFRSVNGLGIAVSILICLVVLAQAVLATSEWYTYKVVKDYVEGPVKDPDRLDRADEFVFLAVRVAACVVFIVWLWRARGNAELFCVGRHRRGRGWLIGGWFCPVVNFWFPKQIVDDVIAASDPRTPPLLPDLRRIARHGLVLAWWLTWVATMVRGNLGNPDLASDVQDVSDRVLGAIVTTVGAVLVAVCAVLAVRVVRLVNRLQMSRPWTPWWATDPSTASPAQYEMSDSKTPVRRQTTRLLMGGKTRGYGTLLLYPDKLAAVGSEAIRIGTFAGLTVVWLPSLLIPPHTGPGALGALIGLGGGRLIGGAIAKSRAAAKVAAGGDNVTAIPLDSITTLQTRKSTRWLSSQHLVVTTADGAEYGFGVKLDEWSTDLTNALTVRGREAQTTDHGIVVTLATDA